MSEDDRLKKPEPQTYQRGNMKFDVGGADLFLINTVVTRFTDWLRERGVRPNENHARNLYMDLGATHCNGCPLDFSALLAMDITPFVEDCMNIGKNLDRNTGKLLNGYKPRCAKASGVRIIH